MSISFLSINNVYLSPIFLRPHREMHPIRALLRTLDQQFVKLLHRIIRVIQQDHRIPHRLLDTKNLDIRRAPRQMIRCRTAAYFLIHLRTPESAINHDRYFPVPVKDVIHRPQMFQPPAEPLQVLNFLRPRIVIHSLHVRYRHLSERKVRR